ncbi:MAG: HD-GYP domain-containing protein [Chloroflexi bacterium]|nr:MAG: HD-GYP domain-containing protein [Chloroflexota bacterium]
MPKKLKIYLVGLVAVSAVALLVTSFVFPINPQVGIGIPGMPTELNVWLGFLFWVSVTVLTSALPVQMPRGTKIAVSIAPVVAAMNLGGPAFGAWVAAVGTTELRELKGRIPWYGSLANHAGIVLPAVVGGVVMFVIQRENPGHSRELGGTLGHAWDFGATLIGAGINFALNIGLVSLLVAFRTDRPFRAVLYGDARSVAANLLALVPLAWLMARVYLIPGAGWWATLLFALPLYTTRVAHHRFVEMREMFTQTIASLAQAVDKRDPFTSNHSKRVMMIAIDIGRVMRLGEPELEALEWGGLLHDVGKIGVPDNILLKQERLTRDERMKMNAHPVLGAEIIAPVTKLAPELPIIRHHHEWYNGSGYPDRLIGDEIPKLARVLHVADAFEAMTAARPYRMKPLTPEQALGELRKFAGIQFDPSVVDAFVKTGWVEGIPDPGREPELRPVPLLSQAAGSMSMATSSSMAAATGGNGAGAHPNGTGAGGKLVEVGTGADVR